MGLNLNDSPFMKKSESLSQSFTSDRTIMIDVSNLVDSEDNFFSMEAEGIESLAEAILEMKGVQENLLVTELGNGKYEIVSGHRRRAAVQLLLDRGEKIPSTVSCLVKKYKNKEEKLVDLIAMNTTHRQLTEWEKVLAVEKFKNIFDEKKQAGEKIGDFRTYIYNASGKEISTGTAGNIGNIKNNGIPEILEAINEGNLSITTGNQIARLSEEEQKKIMSSDLNNVSFKDIKKRADEVYSEKQRKRKEKNVQADANTAENSNLTEKDATCGIFSENNNEISSESEVVEVAKSKSEEKEIIEKPENPEEKLVKCINDNKERFESMFLLFSDMVDTDEDRKILSEFVDIIKEL